MGHLPTHAKYLDMKDPKNAIGTDIEGYQWYQLCPNVPKYRANTSKYHVYANSHNVLAECDERPSTRDYLTYHWPKLAIPFRVYLDGKSEAKTTRDRSSQGVLIYLRSKQIVICFLSDMNIPYALLVRHERCGIKGHGDMVT
jgi:hypothetical protein